MPQTALERKQDECRDEILRIKAHIAEKEAETPALEKADQEAWAAYEETDHGPGPLRDEYEAASKTLHRHNMAILGWYNRIAALEDQIRALGSPIAHHRETAKQERLHDLRRRSAMAKATAKDKGAPDVYLNEKGNFKIGMDARFKSDLINTILGTPTDKALATFSEAEAKKHIDSFGWNVHLDKSRASREGKAAKKAAAAEKRAAEKAQAAADKEAQKATNANKAETGQVAPDPKPGKSKGGMK